MKHSGILRLMALLLVLACLTGSAFAKGTSSPKSFSDVPASAWYYSDVMNAVRQGLVNGKTATTYCPDENLTYAEAVKLAACLAQRNLEGSVTLTGSTNGEPWYMTYAYYAMACDIETFTVAHDPTLANSFVTREDFVAILFCALDENTYTAINTVEKNSIPDYSFTNAYAKEVYGFYRAGILTGDADGSFRPWDCIKRSEVAAILTRMTDPSTRKHVTLTAASGSSGNQGQYDPPATPAPSAPSAPSAASAIQFSDGQYLAVAYLGISGPGMYSPYDETWYEKIDCFGYNYLTDDVTLVDLGGDEMYFLMANPDYGPMAIYTTDGTYVTSAKICFLRCGGPEFFTRCKASVGAQFGGVTYSVALSGENGLPVQVPGVLVLEPVTVYNYYESSDIGDPPVPDTVSGYEDTVPLTYPLSNDDLWTDLILTFDGVYGEYLWVWADEVKYENDRIVEYLGSGYNYYLAEDGNYFVPNYDPADADGLQCVDAQNFIEYVASFPKGVICESMVTSGYDDGAPLIIYQAVVLSMP